MQLSLENKICEQAKATFPTERRLELAGQNILIGVGEDIGREGLRRTPERFAKAVAELCSGYKLSVADVVGQGVFAAEGRGLVTVRDVELHSLCEHHMLPFWGKASVAYFPDRKILGLSKIPRIIDCFARRLQVQERLTREVAEGIVAAIAPRAVAVRITAEHMCMRMRGVEKQGGATVTEFVLGEDQLTASERERLWSSIS